MAKKKSKSRKSASSYKDSDSLDYATPTAAAKALAETLHKISDSVVCKTDKRGYPEPDNRSPAELVVHASEGFIPLWADGVTLRWRFQEQSMQIFQSPDDAKRYFQNLFGEGLLLWGDSSPIRFVQSDDLWDFEIVMKAQDDCDANGCVLASAFFPDAGRHELNIFPTLLDQEFNEQVETMAHEIGHIFGLRHFFAQISETRWRSEIFGTHQPFSIMNYGVNSVMTENDKSDLKRLYAMARSGELTDINGTPVKLVHPFSAGATSFASVPKQLAAQADTIKPSYCCSCGGKVGTCNRVVYS